MNSKKKYLIGGPARCGKTTLTNIIRTQHKYVVGMPFESLFHVYFLRIYPFKQFQKRIILSEWMRHSLSVNEEETEFGKPLDYFKSDFNSIAKQIPKSSKHQIQIIASALDVFVKENNAKTWVAHDIHAEILFAEYKKFIPDLHLIVMLRDPRECICHSLYWRCYPQKNVRACELLEYRTMMWIFSAEAYIYLKKLFPNDVSMFFLNDFTNENSENLERLSCFLDIPPKSIKSFSFKKPDYSFIDGKFLTPDGSTSSLITNEEQTFIEYFTEPYYKMFNWNFVTNLNKNDGDSSTILKFSKLLTEALNLMKKSPKESNEFIQSNVDFSQKNYFMNKRKFWINEFKRNTYNLFSAYSSDQ